MEKIKSIPSIKNILTPGKNVEDEILYGSGRTPDPSMSRQHSSYYGDRKDEPRSYNRNDDFIPSQSIDSQEYNKVETGEVEQPRSKLATSHQGTTQDETTTGHRKDNHSPYTKHSVDPRLGDRTEDPQRPGKPQPPRYSDSGRYEPKKPASSTHDVAEDATQTSPGQFKTRIGSAVDPSLDNGKPLENAYEHTPGGGGAQKADKAHGRESRVASVTLPDNVRYKDPEADENYGLGYDNKLRSGVPYKPPGLDTDFDRREPEVATAKSEAAKAIHGTTTGRHGDSSRKSEAAPTSTRASDGANVAGVNVPAPGYEADQTYHRGAGGPAYKTAPSTAQKYEVEVPRGNDYGRGVSDPRYGLPMSAAGISASEAEALRRHEAYAAQPAATDHAYKTQPPGQYEVYGTKPLEGGEEYTTKPAPKGGKNRRSSLLGFLHKVKPKKKSSKDDEQHIADRQRQSYTDRSGEAPIGTAAAGGYTGQQTTVPTTMGSRNMSSDLAYRTRLPSTADAPAFTGSFVGPNGEPIKVIPKDSQTGYGTSERGPLDHDKFVPVTSGGAAHERVPSAGRAADEAYDAKTADRVTDVGAAGESPTSEYYERENSDDDMRWSSHKGNAAGEALYDQVSPHSSNTDGYKGTQTTHATDRAKGARASDAAYGGKETQARNAPYDYGSNEAEAADAGYGYGGNETQAYRNETQPRETAQDGKWERTNNGLSHHSTRKSERSGRNVLHKDPPSHRMASTAVGGE